MDSVTFERLEFPAVLEHLAQRAESAAAKKAVLETRPWTDPATIRRHWDAVSEILTLLDTGSDLELGAFDDCGEHLEKLAVPNGVIDAPAWMALRRFLLKGAEIRRQLHAGRERMPVCWSEVEALDPLRDLTGEIDRVLDKDGLVRDSASPELRACRVKIHRMEHDVSKVFEKIMHSMRGSDVLREEYSTVRSGRNVILIRANARSRVPGIVHDVSNTGETLFVEPLEVVEISNRLAEEQNHEREEIFRILAELAQIARADIAPLQRNREILIQVDLWRARARLAYRYGLHRPSVEPGAILNLIQAHHPLLFFRDAAKSIPLNIKLEPKNRALIITGPNTGGKTTSLKTVGLIALMVQSAIPVPLGVDSRLPIFQQVLVEMGDDQSVASGLSTFSAHIRRLSWILNNCGKNALVLLDELGKATDPLQAGALGRAIIEALVQRGALVFVTTHLATLKEWAQEKSPMGRNASYRLDPRTHRPQYEIHLDTPGISEAFTIAEAEGLPHAIVEAAKICLPDEEREMSEVLDSLHRKEARLEQEIAKARDARLDADRERKDFHQRRAEVEIRKAELNKTLETEYKGLLDKARADIEKRIANLPSREAISQARKQLERDQEAAKARLEALERREKQLLETASAPVEKKGPYVPREGDWVYVGKSQQEGRIDQLDAAKGRARIAIGGMTVDARTKDLQPAPEPPRIVDNSYARYTSNTVVTAVSPEIDLHGQRVEAALDNADKYLDQAVMARMTHVRVVHGHGTGALRGALHEFFRHHPHVKSFALADLREGGPAVTVVQLK